MLVYSGITPHSPLLLPHINEDGLHLFEDTVEAMNHVAEEIYDAGAESLLVISDHNTVHDQAFSINVSEPYEFDLTEFGQFSFDHAFYPDLKTIDFAQRSLRADHIPVTLTSDESLNYSDAVPLYYVQKLVRDIHLFPVTFSGLSPKHHFQFGQALAEAIHTSPKRIAVIAAGDLSHRLTKDSPLGFHEDGAFFDQRIQEIVMQGNASNLLALDEVRAHNAGESIFKQLLILYGIMDGVKLHPTIHCYEAPAGTGLLTASLTL